MKVREYTEEFYQVNLRVGHVEDTPEKTTKYINGLRLDIQDEINILSPRTIEEACQCALKVEEKITRKQKSSRGCGFAKGKGQSTRRGKFPAQKNDEGSSNQQGQSEKEGGSRGGRPYQRGRGRGRGRDTSYRCYRCNTFSHRSFECLENVLPPKLYLVVFYQVSQVNRTKMICSDFRRPLEVLVVLYHMFIPPWGSCNKCSSMIVSVKDSVS